jgi:hypothetical protein
MEADVGRRAGRTRTYNRADTDARRVVRLAISPAIEVSDFRTEGETTRAWARTVGASAKSALETSSTQQSVSVLARAL